MVRPVFAALNPCASGVPTAPDTTTAVVSAPDGKTSCFSAANDTVYTVSAESALGVSGAFEAPSGARPQMLSHTAGNVESAVRGATRELNLAVSQGQWERAERAAQRLLTRLSATDSEELSDAARDEIHLALSAALGSAERADAWSLIEILLGILALGLPFLVDAALPTDVERLADAAATARRLSSRALATALVASRSGALAADAAVVERDLELLPPRNLARSAQGRCTCVRRSRRYLRGNERSPRRSTVRCGP